MPKLSALVLASTASLAVLSCAAPVVDSSEATGEASSAIYVSPPDTPITTPAPVTSCSSVRVDAFRPVRTCGQIGATVGGEWQIERLFPEQTDPSVHDHFCAYTWVPSKTSCRDSQFDALALSGYQTGTFSSGRPQGPNDAWRIHTSCVGNACTPGALQATERLFNLEAEYSFGCAQFDTTGLCVFPGGGSCTTCGRVVGDTAYMIEPSVDDAPVLQAKLLTSATPLTAAVPITFDVFVGAVQHQFDIHPSQTVFSAKLTPGVSYGKTSLVSWGTQVSTVVTYHPTGIFKGN